MAASALSASCASSHEDPGSPESPGSDSEDSTLGLLYRPPHMPDGLTRQEYCRQVFEGLTVPLDGSCWIFEAGLAGGIRRNIDTARCAYVTERCELPSQGMIRRARHARSIMSDVVPDDMEFEDMPYCIWHPDLATEQTYAKLVGQYPTMRYQVARACAAAGYVELYSQLDILPEVAVAEEAHDAWDRSRLIYDRIMQAPTRYKVMDDYSRTINLGDVCAPAYMNGDTAVRSILNRKVPPGQYRLHWDITEDSRMIYRDEQGDSYNLSEEETKLLHSPLPLDLPNINKDLLILMAAFEGNIDRYARLRRPFMIWPEQTCVLRGMLYHTGFAMWIASQHDDRRYSNDVYRHYEWLRRTMSNDLSWLTPDIPNDRLPKRIWYPQVPESFTLEEILRRRPSMIQSVARACIVGQHHWLFPKLDYTATAELFYEAQRSRDPTYMEHIRTRTSPEDLELWARGVPYYDFDLEEATSSGLALELNAVMMINPNLDVPAYEPLNGEVVEEVTAEAINLHICIPMYIKQALRDKGYENIGLYDPWDPDALSVEKP